MIITVCLPPPVGTTALPHLINIPKEEQDYCRSFSDLQHARRWMEKHGIAFPCDQDWRWP